MHRQAKRTWTIFVWIGAAILVFSPIAAKAVPITGMPVPDLAVFDQVMSDFMDDNGIEAGLLGIMKDGVIVYQRGFGWKDSGHNELLRHDALMRIASCTKPFTAAATQKLIAGNSLALNDFAFDLGQTSGGILKDDDYDPFPTWPDLRLADITVEHLLTHQGGWDRHRITGDQGDHTYKEVQIASEFNDAGEVTSNPPGRVKTVRWIMGQPLDFAPGTQRVYSNVGFLVLGLIVEQVSHYNDNLVPYVRNNVLGTLDWVPTTELVKGRTHTEDRDPREPWYDCDVMAQDVWHPYEQVIESEGGWDHEARIGQGGMVSSTTIMLHLAENYYISDRGNSDPTYGLPTGGVRDDRWHDGNLGCGTHSLMVQRSDGINFAVIFNKKGDDVNSGNEYSREIKALIEGTINVGGFTWPTQGGDGQWADFSEAAAGEGSFEEPWNNLSLSLSDIADEGTLNIKSGTTNWTGTINKKVRIRAPFGGVVRIGQQ